MIKVEARLNTVAQPSQPDVLHSIKMQLGSDKGAYSLMSSVFRSYIRVHGVFARVGVLVLCKEEVRISRFTFKIFPEAICIIPVQIPTARVYFGRCALGPKGFWTLAVLAVRTISTRKRVFGRGRVICCKVVGAEGRSDKVSKLTTRRHCTVKPRGIPSL